MTETITVEVPIEDCYPESVGDADPMIPPTEEWDDEIAVKLTKDIEESRKLRELATERLNDGSVTEADSLLWIDEAEVYTVCDACYAERRGGAWTGSTTHPNHDELRQLKQKQLREGRCCAFCRRNRIKELMEAIAAEVEIEVKVLDALTN